VTALDTSVRTYEASPWSIGTLFTGQGFSVGEVRGSWAWGYAGGEAQTCGWVSSARRPHSISLSMMTWNTHEQGDDSDVIARHIHRAVGDRRGATGIVGLQGPRPARQNATSTAGPCPTRDRRIDYIFVSPGISVRNARVPRMSDEANPSDHCPVIADLGLSGPV
jgi:hypothetical protein